MLSLVPVSGLVSIGSNISLAYPRLGNIRIGPAPKLPQPTASSLWWPGRCRLHLLPTDTTVCTRLTIHTERIQAHPTDWSH